MLLDATGGDSVLRRDVPRGELPVRTLSHARGRVSRGFHSGGVLDRRSHHPRVDVLRRGGARRGGGALRPSGVAVTVRGKNRRAGVGRGGERAPALARSSAFPTRAHTVQRARTARTRARDDGRRRRMRRGADATRACAQLGKRVGVRHSHHALASVRGDPAYPPRGVWFRRTGARARARRRRDRGRILGIGSVCDSRSERRG